MRKDILERFNLITGQQHNSVDIELLTSAQRARFISWLKESGLSLNDCLDGSGEDAFAQEKSESHVKSAAVLRHQIGIDIQKVSELFPGAIQDPKSDPELVRIFSPGEISFAETKADPLATLAGIFAAKEALVKAGYNGAGRNDFALLEIGHDIAGKPEINDYKISISHSGEYAIAIAATKDEETLPNLDASVKRSEDSKHDNASTFEAGPKSPRGFTKIQTLAFIILGSLVIRAAELIYRML